MAAQSFRFLDLPTELRCHVYEQMEFGSIRHVLNLLESKEDTIVWPRPYSDNAEAPCLTFIRPEISINILLVCKLIYKEARPYLVCKMNVLKQSPMRYLADFPAARFIFSNYSPIGLCIGRTRRDLDRSTGSKAEAFGKLCFSHLVQGTGDEEYCRGVNLTIRHAHGVTYGPEVWRVAHPDLESARVKNITIQYMAPFPDFRAAHFPNLRTRRSVPIRNGVAFESGLIELIERQKREEAEGKVPYRNLIPMSEEAFAKHLVALDTF
jgi:hypothetical protein